MNHPASTVSVARTILAQNTCLVFKPRRSYGWVSLLVIGLLALFSIAASIQATGQAPSIPLLLTIGVKVAVCAGAFVLALWFPTMRYELDSESLNLRYGPILHFRISLDEIKTMRRRDLGLTLWSSIRFPGIALFTVPTGDTGDVKMCATAAMKGILLIETAKAKYGITPADEVQFAAAIRSRIQE